MLLGGLLDPFLLLDEQERCTYANEAAATFLEVPLPEVLGHVPWNFCSEELGQALRRECRQVMHTRQERRFTLGCPQTDVWVEGRACPYEDGVAVQLRDITELRQTEQRREALLAATRALAAAASEAEAASAALELGQNALRAAGGLYWRVPADGSAPIPVQRVGAEPGEALAALVQHAQQHPEGLFGEAGAALPLGTSREPLGVLTLHFAGKRQLSREEQDFLRDLAGQLTQAMQRIGAAAASARALDRERARLWAILDQMPVAIWVAEVPSGRLLSGNRAIERMLRHPFRASPTTEHYSEYVGFHSDGRRYESHEWPLARTVLTGERVECEEIEMERGDGTRAFVQYASTLIEDGDRPALAVVTGVDVTERRELSATLEQRVAERTRDLLRRNEELAAETAALQAFASFTELTGRETNLEVLTQAAVQVLYRALGDGSTGYYTLQDNLWKQGPWDGDMNASTLEAAQAGFPADLPLFAQPAATHEPLLVDEWRQSHHPLAAHTPEYGAVGVYPVTVGGKTVGQLAAGLCGKTRWSERDQAVFRAVGRALSLAAERAELTRALEEQKEELAARSRTLEAFAELGRDLRDPQLQGDPLWLVRRAQEILLATLPEGYMVYAEPEGGLWRFKAQVGDLRSAELQAAVNAGLPLESTRNLWLPWQTRQPFYQDRYDTSTDGLESLTEHISATAALPVLVNGAPRGVLAVALFEQAGAPQRRWTGTDRAVLETVVRSLGLALERSESAQALAAKQRELEQVNRDLEAFAYSVSHDLRAPVRHISSFAGLLRRAVADQPRALRYADVIEESAARMNTLIDGLLTFARLGSGEVSKAEVDLGELVAAVRAELAPETGTRHVEWCIGDLPTVYGNATLLRQVLQNLLGNALKYSRPRDLARIEVWAERTGQEHVIHVRDNGVGFDPAGQSRLFEVFQRLHSPQEFEGDGIGLASVQRIVNRHGGRVWAEGRVGEGATFSFSLPA